MLVDINLLPKKEKKKSIYLLIMLLLIVVMAAASYYLWHLYSDQLETKQKLQTELTNVKVEKTALETKAAEPDQNDTVNKLTAAVQWANNQQSSTYSLLRNIASLLPERGFIMNFSFQEDGAASLSVQFDSSREAAYYLKSLSTADFIVKAELLTIQTETLESDTVIDEYAVLPRYTADYQLQVDTTKLRQEEEVGK